MSACQVNPLCIECDRINTEDCLAIQSEANSLIAKRTAQRFAWIPVTERLPELARSLFDVYLVTIQVNIGGNNCKHIHTADFINGEWFAHGCKSGTYIVTHWMPLPPLPEPISVCEAKTPLHASQTDLLRADASQTAPQWGMWNA